MITSNVTTIAYCWLIKLKNGAQYGFTDYSHEISFDNVVFDPRGIIKNSAIQSDTSIAADNFEIHGMIDHAVITKEDVLSGLYDQAYVEFSAVDYLYPENRAILKSGYVNQIRIVDDKFYFNIVGLIDRAKCTVSKCYSETCRAKFADVECGVDKNSHLIKGVIAQIISQDKVKVKFTDESSKYRGLFHNAKMDISSGAGEVKMIVSGFNNNIATFYQNIPEDIKQGDSFVLYPECNKSFQACVEIFNNAINFRGEPHVPGQDEIYKTSASR